MASSVGKEQEASGKEQHAENRGTKTDQVEHDNAQQKDSEHEKSPTEQVLGKAFLVSGDVVYDSRQTREVCDYRQPREDGDSRQTRVETREEEGIHQMESVAAAELLVSGDVGWYYRQNREAWGSRQTREEEGIHQTESVAAAAPSPHMREEDSLILRNGNSPFLERGGSTSKSLSRIHTNSVGLNIADSEAEKVMHLLVLKQQVRELESKPPDPTSPQSSNWSDMIEEEVEDQLQRNKERYKPQWQLQSHTLPATRSRSRSRTKGIANDKSQNRLSKLINKWEPEIVGIAEPMIYPTDLPMSFLQSLGISSAFYSNPSSDPKRTPNLWLLWKDSISAPTMIHFSNQHITVMVDNVLITIVHAHCLYVQRRLLWLELSTINSSNLPWLILGDFNVYLSVSEKRGGNNPTATSMTDFRDFMNNNQLIEVPNSGFQLTWWNKQVGEFKILGKLDRMLCNVNWSSTFPGWKYKVEPIMGHSLYILTQKLKRLKAVLKKWNKETFGNIRFKVEEETKTLELMHEQFESGNVMEEFVMNMVDQENQVELLL
ncbi:hypothetical protein IFM89_033894 [Coptis chinensis]|uniref:Endonuclease/exonuclease/phosphatase domain-containing protein n=1 Tax=Coptis chinensis TaxID=261450 RepID=A0A835H472_9MAGN|nr:hypothetical protein IFM89_033894 [Coptis chinensis]